MNKLICEGCGKYASECQCPEETTQKGEWKLMEKAKADLIKVYEMVQAASKCGCKVSTQKLASPDEHIQYARIISIEYCSKHKSAPKLYEALGVIKRTSEDAGGGYDPKEVIRTIHRITREVLAEVDKE